MTDLKAATPDASFAWATAGFFGADSQAAADPSYFPASGVRAALLALANTWTATQTFTPAVNTEAQIVSGFSLTGANTQSLADWAGTLNTTGSPIVFRFRLTDTAHGGTAKYFSFQGGAAGTTVLLNMDMNGTMRNGNIITSSGLYLYASGPDSIADVSANRTVVLEPNPVGGGAKIKAGMFYGWVNGDAAGSVDTSLHRTAAGIVGVRAASAAGAAISLLEQTAPAGAVNEVRLFAQDNGAGKTQLMAIFSTGAAIQVAIEV